MACCPPKYFVLVLLVVQNTCLVLLMRYSRTRPGTMYLGSTAVCCDEAMKLVTCLGILTFSYLCRSDSPTNEYGEELSYGQHMKQQILQDPKEVIKMGGLALLYTIQKNLLYLAISNLDAAVFQVTYQTKILTTALFSYILLRKKLGYLKIAALLLLTLGVSLVQLDKVEENASKSFQEQRRWVGVLAVLGACCTSGFGGVYFEWVLKRRNLPGAASGGSASSPPSPAPSVWAKNVQLSMFALVIALITAFLKDHAAILSQGFFQGYSPLVLSVITLEAIGGLVVAAVIQYADNILKSFATAVSIVTSTIVSMWVFGFKISGLFVAGSSLVFVAIGMYSRKDEPSTMAGSDSATAGETKGEKARMTMQTSEIAMMAYDSGKKDSGLSPDDVEADIADERLKQINVIDDDLEEIDIDEGEEDNAESLSLLRPTGHS